MKKLFLAFMLLTGFLLASCGTNDAAGKSGDVSFSISANEIGRYIAASREVNGDESIVYEVVAQIKGSKGYYSWIRKQAVYTPDSQQNPTGDAHGYYEAEIPQNVQSQFENDLVFNFKSLSVKQTYTVMLDIFTKDNNPEYMTGKETETPDYWSVCYSGSQDNVSVIPGASKPVTIELAQIDTGYYAPRNFAIKVTYNKAGKNVTEIISLNPDVRSKYSFVKDTNNKYWFAHAGRDWYSVSELKLVFNEDSHFIQGSKFYITANKEDSDDSFVTVNLAESENGEIDLISNNDIFNDKIGYGDPKIEYHCFIKDSNFLRCREIFEFSLSSSKQNFGSYYADSSNYMFIKDSSNEDKNRFRLTIPLTDIIGTDPLAKGDTIVFMLGYLMLYDQQGFSIQQMPDVAYQLQKEGWESLSPEAKDANNTTIKYSQIAGDKICAANFIDGDEKYFQLYIDFGEVIESSVTELNTSLSLNYKIFPASEKVFVFHKAYAEWEQNGETVRDHRKEMIFDLNSYFQKLGKWPAKNSKITINVGGTFKTLSNENDEEVVSRVPLKSELFDNLKIGKDDSACGVEGHNTYYHPLSNSSANGNTFDKLNLSVNGTLENIIFANILEPHDIKNTSETHKYRLQLYKSDGSSNDDSLLIIKNFSISVSVDDGSSNPDVTIPDIGD